MGKMTDREKHIKNLSCIMDSMPDDTCGDWRDSLAYAISSLKTDEAYQIMYEGGEVFTKADIVNMLEKLTLEIEEIVKEEELIDKTRASGLHYSEKIIQQKIDKLKEIKDYGSKTNRSNSSVIRSRF